MLINKALLKYGYSNFSLEILEYCEILDILLREQHYLEILKPEYNILTNAANSLGFRHSEETKLKLRSHQLEVHKSEEHRHKKILANPNSIKIKVTDTLTNEEHFFNSLREAGLTHILGKFSASTTRRILSECLKNEKLYENRYTVTKVSTK
jgi:hypothetical protein